MHTTKVTASLRPCDSAWDGCPSLSLCFPDCSVTLQAVLTLDEGLQNPQHLDGLADRVPWEVGGGS